MDTITTNVEQSKPLPGPFFEKRALRAILGKALELLKEARSNEDVQLVAESISLCLEECYQADDVTAVSALRTHADWIARNVSVNDPAVDMFIVAIEEFLK